MNSINNFPKGEMIPVNGIKLEVFEAGRENRGNPIILCHGWPEHAYSWRNQIPVLVEAGYHVIVPNQRGYGNSSNPTEVTDYDINKLSGDLVELLNYYGYSDAIFVGHDWGAMVVWWLTLLHPQRVKKIINLSIPYQVRGDIPWIAFMEKYLGEDYYFVHFNKKPGVADAVFDENTEQFLNNLYRKNEPIKEPEPGMALINLALKKESTGEPVLSKKDLEVFTSAFKASGFTGSINWYRNLDRNWTILKDVDPIIKPPSLMIYGERDVIPKFEKLSDFVPNVDIITLDCGHWIMEEKPEEINKIIVDWLK
ncbi:alpha/beta fold hydrolase [Spirochaeta cellobiosiphila]|uniref:alpha/beta fold hydrolase n=1 Tax=Spirochaeta cellobiosiphila TaxID=504483 RepID=UPI0003FBCDC8|nr:alpha/beta hydrolase [Spirochaeta cellobiosiphila]